MTDAEVICEFMEPKPENVGRPTYPQEVAARWWRWGWRYVGPSLPQQQRPVEYCWLTRHLTLDALREVETRLIADGKGLQVHAAIYDAIWEAGHRDGYAWHATADQKIKALATVLREGAK